MATPENLTFAEQLISLSLGAAGTYLALRTFYEKKHQETLDRFAQSQTKAYAAERDFEHLRRNQEQMKESIKLLDDEVSETRADLKEVKGMLTAMFARIGDTVSGIFAHKEKRE